MVSRLWDFEEMSENVVFMDENKFWEIIDKLDWSHQGDDDAMLEPAVNLLSEMSVEDIYGFEETMALKLYKLDTMKHAMNIGEGAYVNDEVYFSIDEFLYARCVVVANGRELYEKVLSDPSEFPKDLEFEALLFIAQTAYKLKTEKDWEYSPLNDYETYGNKEEWSG
ncbi:MAG: DUF4240 domain-containing protein [Candidatus Heimdallarchaeota archaeon]|nr:DUF4240 domain-containing protein [Candidatus Heimdallarchaeota archaeon]MDH5646598.1 DUF4240 domain-containing protein [Candidatus Heimdallarchaeota archaeon]